MPAPSALQRFATLHDGSPTRMAAALGEGVLRQHVEHWLKADRVPAEHCPRIERATGGAIRCEELRPDVAWDVLRMQAGEPEGQPSEPGWDGTERRAEERKAA